ncbi:NAD(P)H-dependent oxidoreductase [Eubacteriales bacterium OttesenSCG-928-K08]|nr:NAD(P)H-dependent oxidoreductase [Eubacteriales bacterium OttesenSCG-928-K08]
MKVIVINGSPKGENSNTMKLTRAFLEGAGWADAEVIHSSKVEIKPCHGCFSCWNKTPGKCCIHDDMEAILSKMNAADVIVWSFPLYFFSVPGAMKNIMDRQLPNDLPFMSADCESGAHPARYDLTHQRYMVISTCGFWTSQGNYDGVEATFNHMYGIGGYEKILCGQGELFNIPELHGQTDAYLTYIRRTGEEFLTGKISEETHAELKTPLFERKVYETMADASWGIEQGSSDAEDESLIFTKQMAALYVPDGKERVLEFVYTDIGAAYQLILSKNGATVFTKDFQPYTTRIETPYSVWKEISRGEITGEEALFQRKYSVSGDFNLMLHWDELFSGLGQTKKTTSTDGVRATNRTNMLVLLIPWIAMWIALPIHAKIGGIVGIAAASLVPLLWIRFKPVLYEQVSIPIVTLLCLGVVLGINPGFIVPLSYGAFGVIWFVSSFFKIPLTSFYSAANYGGDSAFNNPLFIKTNRILTAAWGSLYILTSVWTYALMTTAISPYIGLVNSLVPAIMGIFTAWFQKWYPAHWAKGKTV